MNTLKQLARMATRLWAAMLLLMFVLVCGYFVQATAGLPEAGVALSSALAIGPVI